MTTKQRQISLSLQVLLWLWFGVITSFVFTNVVNIAKLETQNKLLQQNIDKLERRISFLEYKIEVK